ncbi:MAG: hypothetical protein M3295_07820, partial [Chloroflexota bacterium]|nr:hypothetical protein [Chloroflexota bacterium]
MSVLVVTDAAMERHRPPGDHPERPARLAAAASGVVDAAAAAGIAPTIQRPEAASDDDVARVHDRAFVDRVTALSVQGEAWLDPDTYLGAQTL